ncbi:MAG: hypothetical protein WBO73_16935 [Gammaproteobacteria bacterium]|jgi:hypothetical protein
MPDKNTTHLPILDDIIVPGDADKSVQRPSSKVQSSLWGDEDSDTPEASSTEVSLAGDPAGLNTSTADTDQTGTTEFQMEDPHDRGTMHQLSASLATEIVETMSQTNTNQADSPTPDRSVQPAPASSLDIDALTEEILGSLMPALEQLLSKEIRQTLRQHLSIESESD